MHTEEQWRAVVGYEGLYEVSDRGRVRSIRNGLMALHSHPQGYQQLHLSKDAAQTSWLVHALVLAAFVGPRPDGQVSRHLDGNPKHNYLSNLRYGTQSENLRDKRRHGTDHNVNKTRCPQGHPYDEANTYVIPSRPDARYCLICNRARARAQHARKVSK